MKWIRSAYRRLKRFLFRRDETPVVHVDVPVEEVDELEREYTEADKRGRTMVYYQALYNQMEVKNQEVVERVVERINNNKEEYSVAESLTGVDWRVIAVIHELEASGRFSRQILNGERWNRRTRLVPRGEGPWQSWAMSCVSAFKHHHFKGLSLAQTLKELEKYNGTGYVRRGINTPYLWSYTNHYTKGKYVSDGKYSAHAVSKQVGAAPILKMLGY